jgi:hypothetical protein
MIMKYHATVLFTVSCAVAYYIHLTFTCLSSLGRDGAEQFALKIHAYIFLQAITYRFGYM